MFTLEFKNRNFTTLDIRGISYLKCKTEYLLEEFRLTQIRFDQIRKNIEVNQNYFLSDGRTIGQVLEEKNSELLKWLKKKIFALKTELASREHVLTIPEKKEMRRKLAMQHRGGNKKKK